MRIILLGLPGSGKEELARSLAKHYQVPVLTLENTLKEIAAEKNELGRLVQEAAFAGKFSDELIMAALRIHLAKPDAVNGFVLEDFPRTTGQAETLDVLMRGLRRPINAVLKVNIEPDDLMEHLVGQITCQNCGEKYNIYSNPPIVEGMCNVCGGRIRRRPDDYEENIANRLRTCEMIMAPLEQYYGSKQLLKLITGNRPAKKMFNQAVKLLDSLPSIDIPEDDDLPTLPTDETLLKALVAPRNNDEQPRRRGRPRRKQQPPAVAVAPKKEAQSKPEIVDEKILAAASGVVAAQKEKPVKASENKKQKEAKAARKNAAAKTDSGKKPSKSVSNKKVAKKKEIKAEADNKAVAQKKTVASKKAPAKKKVDAKKPVAKKKVTVKKQAAANKNLAKKKAVTKKKAAKKSVAKKKVVSKKKVVTKKVTAKKKVVAKKKVIARQAPVSKKVVAKKKVSSKKVVSKKRQPKSR
jgi:adenylate kinase